MGEKDWFRNTAWNEHIEANFRQRLRRARDKSQYLRIQASYLAETHPEVALDLLDQYFALGDEFDLAQAHVDRARALVAMGDIDGALASYEAALEQERQRPSVETQAYLNFACLVVEARIEPLYERALEVLDTHRDRPMFPIDRYRFYGASALALQYFGLEEEAQTLAACAMAATRETHSGLRYHQKLGLVDDSSDEFFRRVAALAT